MLKKPEEDEDWDEISAKEDEMLLAEFERRMSFNKKQVGITIPLVYVMFANRVSTFLCGIATPQKQTNRV